MVYTRGLNPLPLSPSSAAGSRWKGCRLRGLGPCLSTHYRASRGFGVRKREPGLLSYTKPCIQTSTSCVPSYLCLSRGIGFNGVDSGNKLGAFIEEEIGPPELVDVWSITVPLIYHHRIVENGGFLGKALLFWSPLMPCFLSLESSC